MITPHFSLLEFTESATAKQKGIDNTPSQEIVENLRRLCESTLEPLREKLGLPVVITSGYRCQELNNAILHHAKRSQHLKGQAADFYVGKGTRELLTKAFRLIIQRGGIDYDQLILYPTFIHVSYVEPAKNRHYVMIADRKGRFHRV